MSLWVALAVIVSFPPYAKIVLAACAWLRFILSLKFVEIILSKCVFKLSVPSVKLVIVPSSPFGLSVTVIPDSAPK